MKKKKQIIDLENERYGLFMNQNSIELDIYYGRNYLDSDNVQEILIYKINVLESKVHKLYGQSKPKDKKFMKPIKVKAMINIESPEQKYYGENAAGIARDDTGKIVVGVYLKELEEKNIEILRGDIIEYNMSGNKNRYYEVENAENVFDTTDKTLGGFLPYWRKITGIPVKEDVVPFINEANE